LLFKLSGLYARVIDTFCPAILHRWTAKARTGQDGSWLCLGGECARKDKLWHIDRNNFVWLCTFADPTVDFALCQRFNFGDIAAGLYLHTVWLKDRFSAPGVDC